MASFSDLITHTRASTATYVDSSGILQTAASDVPRIGHHIYDGSQWVNEGILHESEARTNLLTYSEAFDNAVWNKGSGVTVATNSSVAPDGSVTADTIYVPESSSGIYQKYTKAADGLVYTWSVYVKGTAGEVVNVGVNVGGFPSYKQVTLTETWARVSGSIVLNNDNPSFHFRSDFPPGDGEVGEFTVDAWGAQLEKGPTPSSYIPTAGSQVTRAADSMTIPAAKLPYDATNMSIAMEGRMTYADTNTNRQWRIINWEKDASNQILWFLNTGSTSTGQIEFFQKYSGTTGNVSSAGTVYSPGINVPFSIASRHGSTFINGAVDGTALTADTTPTALPDLSATDLDLGYDFMGTIRLFRMWSEDLGDTGISEASA